MNKRFALQVFLFLIGLSLILGIALLFITPKNPPKKIENLETLIELPMSTSKTSLDTTSAITTMAWIYPGDPACAAAQEFKKLQINILKPEYFIITNGSLTLLSEAEAGCNGYSKKNVEEIKQYSNEQFATVAAADLENIRAFLEKSLTDPNEIKVLTNFVINNNLTGIEIDFEDFAAWDTNIYQKYKKFLSILGEDLHKNNKKLMVDGPAISNSTEQDYYVWKYEDFKNLPVDTVVVMAYDYQFDHGAGSPIAPFEWLKNIAIHATANLEGTKKLAIGLPSYGYKGKIGSNKFNLLTLEQITKEPGFSSAERDPMSGELTWKTSEYAYFYNDATSLNMKKKLLESHGIKSFSVWHLGGNQWFSNN